MGNLLCIRVHRANIHDTMGGIETMEKTLFYYPSVVGCRADQAYRGTFKETLESFHHIKVDISEQIKGKFEVHPKRWVVERTFSWFNSSRRLSKDYEISSFYQEQICIISNLQTLLRRF
ncbi:MAG: transposase [Oscillospiraceae bacterium]|nr:transposase [Oscillospiraceae bacterium]